MAPGKGSRPGKPQARSPLPGQEERQTGGKHQVGQSLGALGQQGASSA